MSSPDSDTWLDDLFREALEQDLVKTPPERAWRRIEQTVSPAFVERLSVVARIVRRLRPMSMRLIAEVRSSVHIALGLSETVQWLQGAVAVYPLPVSSLIALEPDGSSLLITSDDVPAKTVLDLRLVFRDLSLNFN